MARGAGAERGRRPAQADGERREGPSAGQAGRRPAQVLAHASAESTGPDGRLLLDASLVTPAAAPPAPRDRSRRRLQRGARGGAVARGHGAAEAGRAKVRRRAMLHTVIHHMCERPGRGRTADADGSVRGASGPRPAGARGVRVGPGAPTARRPVRGGGRHGKVEGAGCTRPPRGGVDQPQAGSIEIGLSDAPTADGATHGRRLRRVR